MSGTELNVPATEVPPTGSNSGVCSPTTCPASRSSSGTDTRLTLPVKEPQAGELGLRLLPEGDALPRWYNMSLLRKLPMFPHPEGAVQYATVPLCEPVYVNKRRIQFDLSDPNNYLINNEYNSLNDPYLKHYFFLPKHLQLIKDKDMITPEGRVRCTVKEFNRYRRWLKHIGMLECQKMREDERQKELNMKNRLNGPSDFLEVAVIEGQLHEEEVRQRREQQEDSKERETREKHLDLVRQTAAVERSRNEHGGLNSERHREKESQRATTYERAMQLERKRKRDKLRNYHDKLTKYLMHLKEVEDSKHSGTAQKLMDDWNRMKENQLQYEDDVRSRRERDEERADRYRRLLSLEMNRRWHEQAGKISERRERAKMRQNNLEETYARNIARAFATSRVINPEGYNKAMKAITAGQPKDGELMEVAEKGSKTADEAAEEGSSVPALKTVRYKGRQTSRASLAGFDQPLQSMALDVHLRSVGEVQSDDQQKQSKALAELQKRVSGESVVRLPGVKKKVSTARQAQKEKHAYPTVARLISGEEQEEDIVCIFKPQELIEGESALEEEADADGSPRLSIMDAKGGLMGQARRATVCEGLTTEERETLERLLERLLRDLNAGTLEQEDLVTLAALCAALTQNQLADSGEIGTSTTSLVLKTEGGAGSGDISKASSASSSLDQFVAHTIDKAMEERDTMEDLYGTLLVEDVIKNTVCQMANDLRDGTLSREDVREIGSAVASVVLGEVRSDLSLLAESVVVPTLEQLLRDAEEIDEVLLDQTMASLLATYNQVTRRTDRMVWQVLKDFVVEILLRTKSALIKGVLPMLEFLEATDRCRTTPLHAQLELPCEHELIKVMTTAITKLAGVHKFAPVLCDLMRIVLDQGQRMLVERHGADKLSLPKIDSEILLKLGESACGVEVALEVAATVSDGLYRDMLIDSRFEDSLRLTLAPAFFLVLLSSWGEMMAIVDKESVALQTTAKDVEFTPTVAESVILQSLCMLHKAVVAGDELSNGVITLLALHIAEFPTLIPVSSLTDTDGSGDVRLPLYVVKKIERLAASVQEDGLEPKEVKKLLGVVVHIFVREVLTTQPSQVPELAAETRDEVRTHVRKLVTNLLHKALECVQAQVWSRLSPEENVQTVVGMKQVKQVMQVMADAAIPDLRRSARVGISPSDGGESQLQDIVNAAVKIDPQRRQPWPPYTIQEFLTILVRVIDSQRSERVVLSVKKENTWRVVEFIRIELAALAREIVGLFSGMAILQQQQLMEPCPLLHKMLTFLIAILMELKHALQESVLPVAMVYDFLRSVAKELCGPECKTNASALDKVISTIVQDIEWKRDKSFYFKRLTTTLSGLSLEKKAENVAESMAATAHLLSTINASILTQFIQTTLLSLLNNLRLDQPSTKGKALLSDDETNNQATLADREKEEEEKEEEVVDEKELELNRKRQALNTNLAKANEIRHETEIVAKTILCTMLESLEARQQELSAAAHEVPVVKEHFKHLDRDLAIYAQNIVAEMTEKVENEAEREEAEALAVLILNKTFSSIESGLASGKLQLLRTPSSTDLEDKQAPPSSQADGSQLSSYMVSTLSAVRLELQELHKQAPPGIAEASTTCVDSSQTFKIASDMVDYITNRVQTDAESGKVLWTLTSDQKLTVSNLEEILGQKDYITADDVRLTFRDVMVEQSNQNQFFCPVSSVSSSSSGQVRCYLMPSLPYLLDEFINANLLLVAESLCKTGKEQQSLSVLSLEAVVVATTFHQVIGEMMLKTVEPDVRDRVRCRKAARQTFVLEVLRNSLREVLDVAPDAQLAIEFLSNTQSGTERVWSESLDRAASGVQPGQGPTAKCDLARLMTSIESMTLAARQARSSVSMMEVAGLLDGLVEALQGVIDKLQDDLVEDDDLNYLSKVLHTGMGKKEPRPDRQRAVVRELKLLRDGVHEGTIPPEVLRESADYLNALEPDQRTNPRFIRKVVEKFAASSACVMPDLMKRAVQDLLAGMQPSSVPGVKPGVRNFPSEALAQSSNSRVFPGRMSSLHARTVSKTFVCDKTDNREYPETTLYSANVIFASPGVDDEKEVNESLRKYLGSRRVSFPDETAEEQEEDDEDLANQQGEGDHQQATQDDRKDQPSAPEDLKAQPDVLKAQPEDLKAQTDDLKVQPGDVKAQTDDLKAQTDDLKAQTDDLKAQPDDLKAQPDDVKAEGADAPGANTKPDKCAAAEGEARRASTGPAGHQATSAAVGGKEGGEAGGTEKGTQDTGRGELSGEEEKKKKEVVVAVEEVAAEVDAGPAAKDDADRAPEGQEAGKETQEDTQRSPAGLLVEQVASNSSGTTEGPGGENSNRSASRCLRRDCVSRIDELQSADEKAGNTNTNRETDREVATSYQRLFSYLAQRSKTEVEEEEKGPPRQPPAAAAALQSFQPAAAKSHSPSQPRRAGGPASRKKAPPPQPSQPPQPPKPPPPPRPPPSSGASSTTTMQHATYRSRDGRLTHTTMQMTSERQEEDERVCLRRTGSLTMRRFLVSLNNSSGGGAGGGGGGSRGGGYPQPRPRRAAHPYGPSQPGFTPADRSSGLTAKEVRAQQRAFWTGYGLLKDKSQNCTYPVFPRDASMQGGLSPTNRGEESAKWPFSGKELWKGAAGEKPGHVPRPPSLGCSANQTASRGVAAAAAANQDNGRAGESALWAGVLGQRRKPGKGGGPKLESIRKKEDTFGQSGSVDGRLTAAGSLHDGAMFASDGDPYPASPKLKTQTGETITPKEVRFGPSIKATSPCPFLLPIPPRNGPRGLCSSADRSCLSEEDLGVGRSRPNRVKGGPLPPATDTHFRAGALTRPLRHVRAAELRRLISSLPPDSLQPESYPSVFEKDLQRRYDLCLPPPRTQQARLPRCCTDGLPKLKPAPQPIGTGGNTGQPHPPPPWATSVSYSALPRSSAGGSQRLPGDPGRSTTSGGPAATGQTEPAEITRDRFRGRSQLDRRVAQALVVRLQAIQSTRNSGCADSC